MATRPLVGGHTYHQALTDLRNAADAQRRLLEKTMAPDMVLSPLMRALLFKISYQLTNIYARIADLERIGQQEKAERTTEP